MLRAEFQPISDMRASAAYRSEVLGNLLQRYWLESQGLAHINLESFSVDSLSPDSVGSDRVGPDSLAPDGAAPGRAGNSSAAEAA